MKRTSDELKLILDYEKLSKWPLFDLPEIEKASIPEFISCPKFEKAKTKIDQTMERYRSKVDKLKEEIQQMENNISSMEKEQRKWADKANTWFLDRTNVKEVEKQNHAADNANRLIEQISRANEKRNDLIDKHNEALEEANEKLKELESEALLSIDEDIVAVLDRCTKIVDRLDGSQNIDDLLTALEICLMEFRVFAVFEDKIEGNSARKDCRDRISDVNRMFSGLCENETVKNGLINLFKKISDIVTKNNDSLEQIEKLLGTINYKDLTDAVQAVNAVLTEQFNTNFDYEGVIDPIELDEIVTRINKSISALRAGIEKADNVFFKTDSISQTSFDLQKNVEIIFQSMNNNVDKIKDIILASDHFAIQMIEEKVIDNFYNRDVKPSAISLRKLILKEIGEAHVNLIIDNNKDIYSIGKTENTIKKANLLQLHDARGKIDGHKNKLLKLIKKLEEDLKKTGDVPQQNADALVAEMNKKYLLSCLPFIGFLFGIGIMGKIKSFEPAFKSTNQIYRSLGTKLLEKNGKMIKAIFIVGIILGLGGMGAFFVFNSGSDLLINAGVPGALIITYGLTAVIFSVAGKKLVSYMGENSSK